MYGNGGLVLATAVPISIGAAFLLAWYLMAAITIIFVLIAVKQFVTPGYKIRP